MPKPKGPRDGAPPDAPADPPPAKANKASTKASPRAGGKAKGPGKAPSTKAKPSRGASGRRASAWRWWTWPLLALLGVGLGGGAAFWVLLEDARQQVAAWQARPPAGAPSTVWSAPMRLRKGDPSTVPSLVEDLLAAGYERADAAAKPGQFAVDGGTVAVWSPARGFAGFQVPEARGRITVGGDHVTAIEPSAGLLLHPTVLGLVGDTAARRTPVRLAELSPWMVPALLAIEDARFREHPGVDPIGVTRAAVRSLTDDGLQGGSTLTQQLAKNIFLGQQRTVRRKVRELFLAFALESSLDKDALLELYLSEVYLGHTAGLPVHGVEQAARTWFGHGAGSLSVAEAATIAGVIASPNQLSPSRDVDAARARRDVVLERMVAVHALTRAQADEAKATPITLVDPPVGASWRLPWAVTAALDAASDALGGDLRPDGGHHVYTSVQPHLQRAAARGVGPALDALGDELSAAEVALTTVSVADGAVLAIVGGRDFKASPFPRATRAWREAGSTVKPLLLLAAMDADRGLTPASAIPDQPKTLTHDGTRWTPRNADGRYLGAVPLGVALLQSRNLPFVHLTEALGWSRAQEHLLKAGLSRATDFPSVALGGMPTTVVELAGAYTAFPGGGVARRPWVVRAVTDGDGRITWSRDDAPVRLSSARAAAVTRHLLEAVVTDGTARAAAALGVRGAFGAKTGTTDNGRDAWLVGFDPEQVTAVWVGQDRGTLGVSGGKAALPVWAAWQIAQGAPRGRFKEPGDVVGVPTCADDLLPPCPDCAVVRTTWFPADRVPAADCAARAVAAPVAPPAEAPPPPAEPAPDAASKPADAAADAAANTTAVP